MTKNDFQYGGWNYYTVQCGTIMTLISPVTRRYVGPVTAFIQETPQD